MSLTLPSFTLSRLYEHVLHNQIQAIRPPRKRIADIFPAVSETDFQDLLLDMRMYCRQLENIIDEVERAGTDSSVTWETNVHRNLIQYRLLRLRKYRHNEDEICRLGALIFSFGVIYLGCASETATQPGCAITSSNRTPRTLPFLEGEQNVRRPWRVFFTNS